MDSPSRKNGIEKRMSVEDKSYELVSYFYSCMNKLRKMWNDLEIDEDTRIDKTTTLYGTMKEIIDIMMDEETTSYNKVIENCKNLLNEINLARAVLGKKQYDAGTLHCNTIAYCTKLQEELKFLEQEKENLLQEQIEVFDSVEALSRRLSIPIENLDLKGTLLAPEAWNKLQKDLVWLIELFVERVEEFEFIKEDIVRLKDSMKKPCTQREIEILNVDVDTDDFIYSEKFLNEVRSLHSEAKTQYDNWRQQKVADFNENVTKLRFLYYKCFVPERDRLFSGDFTPDYVDDRSMNKIQDEIRKYEKIYKPYKELYDAYYNWSTAWNDHLQVKADIANPSFYINRGGQISKVLSRQKDTEKRLKQYLQILESLDNSVVKINGLTLYQKAVNIIEEEKKQKELEKQLKLEWKKKNLKRETIYETKKPHRFLKNGCQNGSKFLKLYDEDSCVVTSLKEFNPVFKISRNTTCSPKNLMGASRMPLRKYPFREHNKSNVKRCRFFKI